MMGISYQKKRQTPNRRLSGPFFVSMTLFSCRYSASPLVLEHTPQYPLIYNVKYRKYFLEHSL